LVDPCLKPGAETLLSLIASVAGGEAPPGRCWTARRLVGWRRAAGWRLELCSGQACMRPPPERGPRSPTARAASRAAPGSRWPPPRPRQAAPRPAAVRRRPRPPERRTPRRTAAPGGPDRRRKAAGQPMAASCRFDHPPMVLGRPHGPLRRTLACSRDLRPVPMASARSLQQRNRSPGTRPGRAAVIWVGAHLGPRVLRPGALPDGRAVGGRSPLVAAVGCGYGQDEDPGRRPRSRLPGGSLIERRS
jgi:hypothetical protein